jgi:hypothetical protein
VTAYAPAPPPPENQHAATAMKPPRARALAHSTYCRANPCVPCRMRTAGKGPVPDGRATAARITPSFGTATLTHFTRNVSVPAGASVAVTIGGVCNPRRHRLCRCVPGGQNQRAGHHHRGDETHFQHEHLAASWRPDHFELEPGERPSYVPDRSHSADACSSFVCCVS